MNTILLSASIISIYLSLFIITKKCKSVGDKFLFIYFVINSLIFLIGYLSFEFDTLIDLQFFLINIELLTTPIYYLYVHFLITGKSYSRKRIVKYFVPYIFSFIYLSFKALTLTSTEFDELIYRPFLDQPLFFGIISIMEFLVIPFYSLLILKLLIQHRTNIKKVYSYNKGIDLKWINIIVILSIISWLFMYIPYFLKWDTTMLLGMSLNGILIFYIGFFGIKQTQIFVIDNSDKLIEKKEKYKKSAIDKSSIENLKNRLINYMEDEKPYLDNELNIYKIAQDLGVSNHNLSQVFTIGLEKSFYNVVNEYRVDEFKRKIEMGEHKDFTLLSLAMDSGFNSKSSFNRIFKTVTGITPSSYIKSGKIPIQNE